MIKNEYEPVRVADAILDFQSRLERLETKYNIPFKHKWSYNLLLKKRVLQQGKVTEALLEFQKRINVLREVMLSDVSVTLHTVKGDTVLSDVVITVDGKEYVSDNNGVINIPLIREGLYRVYAKKGKFLRGVEYIKIIKDKSTEFNINLKVTR
jgi:hypothetical protein